MGIQFGIGKKAIGRKGFTYVGLGKPDELVFNGGTFANFPVQEVTPTFFKDQFFQAEVDFLKTDDNAKSFSSLMDAYIHKYGV